MALAAAAAPPLASAAAVESPDGRACASPRENVSCDLVAVSGTGRARSLDRGGVAASGTGNADSSPLAAASGTGDAEGDERAVSLTGNGSCEDADCRTLSGCAALGEPGSPACGE